jgi:hypothetical protein
VALWQFITFTILIGALLVFASVITRRLGRANTRLKSIEEILLANSRSIGSADTRAVEAKAEVSGGQESRGGYLTIRDLRPPSSGATGSSSRNFSAVAERGEALKTPRDHVTLPSLTPERGGTVPVGAPRGEALKARSEQLSSQRPLTVTSVPTILESRSAPATNSGRQSPPGDRPASDESVAKKNREMTLFLMNQRRRRRARLGY